MAPPDVEAVRAVSEQPMKTRWKPVDLVCRRGEEEVTVRTKLARDQRSAAVSVAESVSHALLQANGFRMAEAFSVVVGKQFARDLTVQYDFQEPVQSGRHWGTRLMRHGVQEVEFTAALVSELADPSGLFRLYLADVVLGNPDRRTHGNVLLAHRTSNPRRFDLIPIDQSEAFLSPSIMIDSQRLRAHFNSARAEPLDGMESVLLDSGPSLVETCFADAKKLKDSVGDCLEACHEEWFERASVDPAELEGFLEHRLDTLDILARKKHWLGVASVDTGGQHVLTIQ